VLGIKGPHFCSTTELYLAQVFMSSLPEMLLVYLSLELLLCCALD
jgi:hypothetical protein